MGLWHVRDPKYVGSDLLAWSESGTGRVFAYSPNFGTFRFNPDLTTDFVFDRDWIWVPIGAERARSMIQANVGWIDPSRSWEALELVESEETVRIDVALSERDHS